MGKNKDFSVFIMSGHVLYCCLFPFGKLSKKRENKTSHSTIMHVLMNAFTVID